MLLNYATLRQYLQDPPLHLLPHPHLGYSCHHKLGFSSSTKSKKSPNTEGYETQFTSLWLFCIDSTEP